MGELIEVAFGAVALLLAVIGALLAATAFEWNHRGRVHLFRRDHDGIGIVAPVRDYAFSPLSMRKLRCRRIFAGLPCVAAELKGQPIFVDVSWNRFPSFRPKC